IATIVAKRMAGLMAERGTRPDALTLTMGRYGSDDATPAQGVVVIDGNEGASVQLSVCCRPIPGDSIVGYLGRGEGLVVHCSDCGVSKRLFERDPDRWIAVEWSDELSRSFEAGVAVLLNNSKGALGRVA
ncbi:guanosine-3',5'-bis(diphosphate) 3'-pyrophosphohydrolase, partial [Escherichia coli]|nr:guanosine-3',5'-bis(diphosphate) 3'-pyrophosphohydrolase [Escherichia coli]